MKATNKLMWSLLLATGLLFTSISCKKSANDMNAAIENNSGDIVSVMGKTVDAKPMNVQMTRALMQQAKAGQPIRLQQNANGTYTGVPAGAAGSAGITSKPPNCPPVSPETIDYYQQEANNCCCSFIVCLVGEYCDYYFYYFMPNNGCENGGELE